MGEHKEHDPRETFTETMGAVEAGHSAIEILEHFHAIPHMPWLGPVLGPLGLASGTTEMAMGGRKALHAKDIDEKSDGALEALRGAAGTVGSAATMTGMSGPLAPAMAAGAAGVAFGHYGDNQVKKHGLLKDHNGESQSASDWAADKGWAMDQAVASATGSKGLGTAAGLLETGKGAVDGAVLSAGVGLYDLARMAAPGGAIPRKP